MVSYFSYSVQVLYYYCLLSLYNNHILVRAAFFTAAVFVRSVGSAACRAVIAVVQQYLLSQVNLFIPHYLKFSSKIDFPSFLTSFLRIFIFSPRKKNIGRKLRKIMKNKRQEKNLLKSHPAAVSFSPCEGFSILLRARRYSLTWVDIALLSFLPHVFAA